MGIDAIFNAHNWAVVPFHFWSLCFFVLGCIVGSFLNVCIYRMPLDLSVVSPPSHCPHCKYSIPFYLNIPLRDVARAARQMQKLRRADFAALFHRGTAHRRGVFRLLAGVRRSPIIRCRRSRSRWFMPFFSPD